jgi:hypothetical protein
MKEEEYNEDEDKLMMSARPAPFVDSFEARLHSQDKELHMSPLSPSDNNLLEDSQKKDP